MKAGSLFFHLLFAVIAALVRDWGPLKLGSKWGPGEPNPLLRRQEEFTGVTAAHISHALAAPEQHRTCTGLRGTPFHGSRLREILLRISEGTRREPVIARYNVGIEFYIRT